MSGERECNACSKCGHDVAGTYTVDGDHYPMCPKAADALLAERDSLRAEVERLQREVVNRNRRALEGDRAVGVREGLLDRLENKESEIAAMQSCIERLQPLALKYVEHAERSYQQTKKGRPGRSVNRSWAQWARKSYDDALGLIRWKPNNYREGRGDE